jgi:hypothetical protein
MNLKNQRKGGCYWDNGMPYISVTQILSCIDKPALRYWFGQQVYLAMVKNPELSEQEALAAPYKTSDEAKNRGTTVHSIVENYNQISIVEDCYKGYYDAFGQWIKDMNVTILENEKTVYSDMGYAGTLDLLVEIGGKKTIVDVKTGKAIYPEAHLQVSAYQKAMGIDNGAILLLQPNGKYKYEQANDEFTTFMACKTLYEGLNREKLEKLGYKLFNK